MGTRHLTVVISKKKVKVAQYGQWDGYPQGQGETIRKFLNNKTLLKKLTKNIDNVKFVDETNIQKKWEECGADPNSNFVTMDISEKFRAKYPELSRDTGAEILNCIVNGATELENSYEFATDSLFCEWAYVIDLDKKVLEIYKGFNKLKPKGRFAKLISSDKNGYQPVTLVKKLKFTDLTKGIMSQIEKDLSND